MLRYQDVDMAKLTALWPELGRLRPDVAEQIEIDACYAGYLERQEADIRAFRRDEALLLPEGLDYQAVPGLSNEARQVLAEAGPATLGAAARLPGMTPAALVTLLRYVRRRRASAPGQGEEHAA
jgi:tRNA uridine 5-carboxymethylaminomethyl modification enzyme